MLPTSKSRVSRILEVAVMSSSLGVSLGFVRYLSKIWSRALRAGFEAVLEGLLKKLVREVC
jgi:hypothetical protein